MAMTSSWPRLTAIASLGLLGCGRAPESPVGVERIAVTELRACGVSGVASREDGAVWAVSESRRELYRFGANNFRAPFRVAVDGLPVDLELESAAWLSKDRLLLGTETETARDEDVLLVLDVDEDRAVVADRWVVDWSRHFGLQAKRNQGVEGLCASEGWVVAAAEFVTKTPDGRRRAPILAATYEDAAAGHFSPYWLELTSETGKISALECVKRGESLVVHAVERHFEVTRVVGFDVPLTEPAGDAPTVLVPEVLLDLKAMLPGLANVEGMTYVDGRMIVVTDHDEDSAFGDTEVIVLPEHTTTAIARRL